ncbi:tetratricopeptide repeat protein [Phytohabitans sp. LJ34]|uniref:tetratricopeptide repeat protein n=1 Tax=Phytohabitans sp. LJ34 TaxID=3452217 RepID=UPI003F8B9691
MSRAKDILKIAAWLAPEDIPAEVLPDPGRGWTGRRTRRQLSGILRAGDADGTVSIAPELQREIRERHGADGRAEAVLYMRAYLGDDDPAITARCFRLLPHMLAWISLTDPDDDFLRVLDLLDRATVVLLTAQNGAAARPLIDRTVRSATRLLDDDDPRLLTVRDHRASVHEQEGAPHRAVRVREEAIAAARLDPDHPAIWLAYANLAVDLQTIGAFDRALELARRVADRHRRVLGPAHPETLKAIINVGAVQRHSGRPAEALAVWRDVLADADRELGADHPVTALIRRAIAAEDNPGDLEPAEPSGPITAETIQDWVDHGAAARRAGNPAIAGAVLRRVVDEGTQLLGPGHPEVIRARWHLAGCEKDGGDPAAALATLRTGLADADRVLGRTHRQTATIAFFLIAELLDQGHQEEYEAMLEDRLPDQIEVLGFGDPIVRELAVRRSALRLGRPSWWRTR